MLQYARPEIMFVLPLDLGHSQQTIDQLPVTACTSIACRCFVFDNIFALEFSGAIHGDQPTAEVTENPENASDNSGSNLTHSAWSCTQSLEHLTDEFAVMPFFVFDDLDTSSFVQIGDRMP